MQLAKNVRCWGGTPEPATGANYYKIPDQIKKTAIASATESNLLISKSTSFIGPTEMKSAPASRQACLTEWLEDQGWNLIPLYVLE